MSVREFTDGEGREWRAWDIRPDAIHPKTKAEDYLAECYDVGWIVFETRSGTEKRRLCPYPVRWAESSEAELCRLLERADAVAPLKLESERRVSGAHAVPSFAEADLAGETPDVTDLDVVRSFRYPGGRIWTACIVVHPSGEGSPVLRFTAGMRTIDLKAWPKDWADQPEENLADLLRLASPRRSARPTETDAPRRRWTDKSDKSDDKSDS